MGGPFRRPFAKKRGVPRNTKPSLNVVCFGGNAICSGRTKKKKKSREPWESGKWTGCAEI